ncbi:FHA domain-containing protein [Cryobacterium frigoriphilum]|uniref:FHA domain-containing protein n=1 Tax=Cryobacterium frigoriphilum TaxID=1259150 RepID=A0A4R8ZYE4_9MICO|nr:FHA domain-containing protein [Cryobacterium frigoriphilum]TFD48890.1 FHA domain-containing protein [Cryobacterium frigoriphilum]
MPQGRVAVVMSPGAPAAWIFVVGRRFLAGVPFGTARGVVDCLTERVLDEALDLESIVALLPLTGAEAITSFLVVVPRQATDGDGIPVSAVVRGTAMADVFSIGGSRRFSDRGIRPWLLADFRAVTGLVIGSMDAPMLAAGGLGAGQRVGTGAFAGTSLFWSVLAAPESDDVGTAYEAPRELDGLPEYDTVIRPPRALAEADTVLRVPTESWAGSERAESRAMDADTVIRPPHAARHGQIVGEPEPTPAPAPAVRDDPQAGPTPRRDPATERVTSHAFQLSSGEPHRLDQAYVLGRKPRLPRIVIGQPPRLLAVPSPTSAVSSTHLEIRQEGDSIVVTDLGSTNGTVVRPPHGRTRRLRSGQSLAVTPGTVVDIGDGNSVEILR